MICFRRRRMEEAGVVTVVRKESRLRSSPASCVSLNLTLLTSWDHLDTTIHLPSQPSKVLLFHWWLWYFAAAFMQTKLDIFIKTSGRFPNPESVVTKHDHFLTLTRPLAQRWHNAELKCHFQHILGFAETYNANTTFRVALTVIWTNRWVHEKWRVLCFQRQQNQFPWNKKSNSQTLFPGARSFKAGSSGFQMASWLLYFCQSKEHFDRLLVKFEYMTLPNPPNLIISRISRIFKREVERRIK